MSGTSFGACVLHDCVPSKTFIASSEVMTGYRNNDQFGVRSAGLSGVTVDAVARTGRPGELATEPQVHVGHAGSRLGPFPERVQDGRDIGRREPPP